MTSGGARPKVFYKVNGEDWIVKFPSSIDHKDIGAEEYAYSMCAKRCGIKIPETKLIASNICSGYFATKRFDVAKGKKFHMASACGLLESTHRLPAPDYNYPNRSNDDAYSDFFLSL